MRGKVGCNIYCEDALRTRVATLLSLLLSSVLLSFLFKFVFFLCCLLIVAAMEFSEAALRSRIKALDLEVCKRTYKFPKGVEI